MPSLPPQYRWLVEDLIGGDSVLKPNDADSYTVVNGYPIADIETPKPFRVVYDPFDYHVTSEDCRVQLAATRRQFKDLRDFIEETVPNCRERSLAITALQDSLMRAIQAVVFTHPDSYPVADQD